MPVVAMYRLQTNLHMFNFFDVEATWFEKTYTIKQGALDIRYQFIKGRITEAVYQMIMLPRHGIVGKAIRVATTLVDLPISA